MIADRLSPIFPFPCDRCGRCTGCPCVVDPDELALIAGVQERRHAEAVQWATGRARHVRGVAA